MRRHLFFILAIALAVPYLAVLAGGDAFDARPDERPLDDPQDRSLPGGTMPQRDPSKGDPRGVASAQVRIDKNEVRLPDDGRSPDPNQRVWQYDRD